MANLFQCGCYVPNSKVHLSFQNLQIFNFLIYERCPLTFTKLTTLQEYFRTAIYNLPGAGKICLVREARKIRTRPSKCKGIYAV